MRPVEVDMAGNGCSGTYRVTAVSVDNETHPEIDARRLLPDHVQVTGPAAAAALRLAVPLSHKKLVTP